MIVRAPKWRVYCESILSHFGRRRRIFGYIMQELQNSLPSLPPLTVLVDEEVGNVPDYVELMGETYLAFLDLKTAGLFVL